MRLKTDVLDHQDHWDSCAQTLSLAVLLLGCGNHLAEPPPACHLLSDCRAGSVCVSGVCGPCTSQSQCLPGDVCLAGLCGPCIKNAECSAGQACLAGACGACVRHSQCDMNQHCLAGVCMVSCAGNPWLDTGGNHHDGILRHFESDPNGGWTGNGTPADPYALQFDGIDDYVELGPGAAALQPTHEFSVEVWLLLDAATVEGIFSNRASADDVSGICVGKGNYPEWGCVVATQSSGGWLWLRSDAASALGRWTQLVVTFSVTAGVARLFIDGVRQKQEEKITAPLVYSTGSQPRLGEKDGIYPYHGKMATVRVWGAPLSDAEVASLFARDAPRFGLAAPPQGKEVTAPLLVNLEARKCLQ